MTRNSLSLVLLSCLPFASFAQVTAQPTSAMPATTTPIAAQPVAPTGPLNCDYHFPKDMKVIESTDIETWSKNAAIQAFTFESAKIDTQLSALKPCFTEQGWAGFNSAFQKSGNLEAIKSKQLTVSSVVNGHPDMTAPKDNQWKITLPMQVTYKNNEQALDQSLTVNLLITRKPSGDLGIMQVVAVPVKSSTNQPKTATLPKTQ